MIQYHVPSTDKEIEHRLSELMTQAEHASTRREIKAILSDPAFEGVSFELSTMMAQA